jgi:3-oxoacyl-[acyl-carrier protein] reductase
MVDKNRFNNRVALITGTGSEKGIGFATADILAKCGARVAITSTTDRIYERANELEGEGLSVKGYIADLMRRDQVKQLADNLICDFIVMW